ncbi:MAG: hypothetical protein HRU14_12030 [Planctomycetes bacterium]|nr:hypothetical protein [Planctomycetota bacterium]
MARRRSRLRNVIEFAFARTFLFGVQLMPAAMLAPTSRLLGRLLYRVISSRRKVVRENIRLAFGEGPDAPDPDRIGRASLAHLALSFMELARLPRNPDRLKARITIPDPDALERLQSAVKNGGAVIAGAHFGAYEVLGLASPLFGVPAASLVRPLDNPYLERWLQGARQRHGQQLVDNRGGTRELASYLDKGRMLGVMVDINRRSGRRMWVDFFGVPAATAPTAAVLAFRAQRPLFTIVSRRTGRPLEFEFQIGEPHLPRPNTDRDTEVQRLMQTVTDEIEQRVRSDPGQWLWTHRRWKTRPEPQHEA